MGGFGVTTEKNLFKSNNDSNSNYGMIDPVVGGIRNKR
jgi:hypothetical protein